MNGQSAIHHNRLSSDVSGIVRSQKSDGSCNILRFSQIRSGTLTEEDITYILIQVVNAAGVSTSPGATALQRMFFFPI